MKTRNPIGWPAESPLFDPEFVLTVAALVLVLTVGGVAIHAAYRWYRNLKQTPTGAGAEDAQQWIQSLEQDEELDAEELARLRAALDKQKLAEPLALKSEKSEPPAPAPDPPGASQGHLCHPQGPDGGCTPGTAPNR